MECTGLQSKAAQPLGKKLFDVMTLYFFYCSAECNWYIQSLSMLLHVSLKARWANTVFLGSQRFIL